jgi:hypothetical protein
VTNKLAKRRTKAEVPRVIDKGWGQIIDELKAKEMIRSDMALAEILGVTRAFISAIRKLRRNMPPDLGEDILMRLGRKLTRDELTNLIPVKKKSRLPALNASDPHLLKTIIFKRAQEKCELCGLEAPFVMPSGMPYLELHHIVPISEGGKAVPENAVVLCPNCHKKVLFCPNDADTKILRKKASKALKAQ